MQIILIILLMTVSMADYAGTPVVVNGYSNYHGYNTSEGCYGTGCLPTAALQEVISRPSYYSPERVQNERLIDAIEDSNEINKELLKLETENGVEE
jgi:hypothetical protein